MNKKLLAFALLAALGGEIGKPKKLSKGKDRNSPAIRLAERKRAMRAEKLKHNQKKLECGEP